MYPKKIEEKSPIELKLGIKSSLPNPLKLISLVYFIWLSNEKNTDIEYCDEITVNDSANKLVIKNNIFENLKGFLNSSSITFNDDLKDKIEDNPLFKSQFESLVVALELIWRISKIKFSDHLSSSSERSGGSRYKKKLSYTRNIDVFHSLVKDIPDILETLFDYIAGTRETVLSAANINEMRLAYALTFIMEDSIYSLNNNLNEKIIFSLSGIYDVLSTPDNNTVTLDNSSEDKGSFRILKSLLKENLNFILELDGTSVKLRNFPTSTYSDNSFPDFSNYFNRLKNYNDLNTISIFKDSPIDKDSTSLDSELPHQKIIYGAPGTGKSYYLSKHVSEHFPSFSSEVKTVSRVTFYDGYSYGQFVGTYKPYSDNTTNEISYEYVPGPLLLQILNAYKYPDNNFILVIEEINRAKPDRVFGDIFQLLDRDSNGNSEYPIFLSREQNDFFIKKLSPEIYINTVGKNNDLYLPRNLYIWATMNSADQGVYPMDTAFKRRWDFEYIPLNKNREDKDYKIQIGSEYYSWSLYRNTINDILGEHGITEDRLISPFFLKSSDFNGETLIIKKQSYINKFLMYLFDDILKHNTRLKELIFIEKNFYKVFSRINNEEPIYTSTFISLLNDKKTTVTSEAALVKDM